MHQLAVQVKQHTLGESLFSKRQPEYLPYRQEKAQDLNIEHARVKCALPPHVMPDVTMFVTTYVEAHGIPTGTARRACRRLFLPVARAECRTRSEIRELR